MICRITFILLLFSSIYNTTNAQPYIDKIVSTKLPECEDIAYSSSVFFARYIQAGQYDSAQLVLDYWEGKCGVREPVLRARLIMAFVNGANIDHVFTPEIFDQIHNYMNRVAMINNRDFSRYDYSRPYFGFVPIGQEFDSFSVEFFTKEQPKQSKGTSKYILSKVYSNDFDSVFAIVQTNEYSESRLHDLYYQELKKYKNMPETNVGGLVGVWIPTGDISLLGAHPQIGFIGGVKYRRLNVDGNLSFKFLKSNTPYYARRVHSDSSIALTDKFFGYYLGVDLGFDVLYYRNTELQLLGGIAADGFEALNVVDEGKSTELKEESAWSYNFNFGLGYRYYFNTSIYVGVQAKYNIVDYSRNGVINFTGNPVTINIVVGGLTSYAKRGGLARLQYRWRE